MERSDSTESRTTPAKDSSSSTDRPLQRPPSISNLSTLGSTRGSTPISVMHLIFAFRFIHHNLTDNCLLKSKMISLLEEVQVALEPFATKARLKPMFDAIT